MLNRVACIYALHAANSYLVGCNTPLKKGMLSKDFKDSLGCDPLKSITGFLFILVHTGSYPMCGVNLKFSYRAVVFFALLSVQVNVQPGSGKFLSTNI